MSSSVYNHKDKHKDKSKMVKPTNAVNNVNIDNSSDNFGNRGNGDDDDGSDSDSVNNNNDNDVSDPACVGALNNNGNLTNEINGTSQGNNDPACVDARNSNSLNSNNNLTYAISGTLQGNNELEVFIGRKWIHLSSFNPSVTEENIISYTANHTDIIRDDIKCAKLVKKDAIISTLRKIRFKVGVSAINYGRLFDANIWPNEVKVRESRFFPQLEY